MRSVYLSIFSILVASGLMFAPAFSEGAADTVVSESELPSLYISKVSVENDTYNAGDTIRGVFVVSNRSGYRLGDLSYRMRIGTDYKEPAPGYKFPGSFLDVSKNQDSFSLEKGESKTIPFSYVVPSFLTGKQLAVQIAVLGADGRLIAWGDSNYFSLGTNVAPIGIAKASVLLSNGEVFGVGDGPTIYEGKEPKNAYASIDLRNTTEKDINVFPVVSTRKQSDAKVEVTENPGNFVIHAGKTENIKITLPVFSYDPAVYFSEIVINDAKGNPLVSRIGARYIIGGDIATVHSVGVDKVSLEKKESFTFIAELSGRPADRSEILAGKEPEDLGTGSVAIFIYNEKNALVAKSIESFNLEGNTSINKKYSAQASAGSLRLELKVMDKAGNIILDYKTDLGTSEKDNSKTSWLSKLMNIGLWGGFGLLVLVILVVLILMIKNRVTGSKTMMSLASFITIGLIPIAVLASCASAGVSFTSLSSPASYQHFRPNQQIYTSGAVSYEACENTPARIDALTATLNGQTVNANAVGGSWSVGAVGGTGWYPVEAMFMAGPLTTPSTPGTYVISYYIHYTAGICSGSSQVTRHIVVEAPPPQSCMETEAPGKSLYLSNLRLKNILRAVLPLS